MATTPSPIPQRPRPRPVRVIGVLNIVFGSILLMSCWVMLGGMAFNGMSAGPTNQLEAALLKQAEVEHREALGRLESLEQQAEYESARERYRSERVRLEERGATLPLNSEMLVMGGQMQGMMTWTVLDAGSGFVLNLLLIASGVGLLQRVEWGRRLGLWAAGLKLARLVVSQLIWLVVIVPELSRTVGESVGDAVSARGGGMPAGVPNMTQLYAVIYSAWGVFMLVFGSIYPIVVLVLLRRPGVRAACEPADVRGWAMLREAARS